METGIASVAAITIISSLVAQAIKATSLNHKWLPVICGLCGALLGIVGLFTIADFPAGDTLSAIAVGIVSGLAATGTHQILKQFSKGEEAADEDN